MKKLLLGFIFLCLLTSCSCKNGSDTSKKDSLNPLPVETVSEDGDTMDISDSTTVEDLNSNPNPSASPQSTKTGPIKNKNNSIKNKKSFTSIRAERRKQK